MIILWVLWKNFENIIICDLISKYLSEYLEKFWGNSLKIQEEIRKVLEIKKKLLDILAGFWVLNLTDEIVKNFCKNVYNNFMSYERILKKSFAI